MCIGFPGRVVAVDSLGVTVQTEDRRRRASTLLVPDLAVGDWVLVAAGTVVDRLDDARAESITAALTEAIALEAAEAAAAEAAAVGKTGSTIRPRATGGTR
jgi:hydrogenase assembly chaperone HypC/HupF